MEKKIIKSYIDEGFGFPVQLLNVPMVKIRGEWTPAIDYKSLTESVLKMLCEKSARLTGNEVRFIRHHFEMTLEEFANRFEMTHPAVIKWEKMKNMPTGMRWVVEKDLRLFVFKKLLPKPYKEFFRLYTFLEVAAKGKAGLKIDFNDLDITA